MYKGLFNDFFWVKSLFHRSFSRGLDPSPRAQTNLLKRFLTFSFDFCKMHKNVNHLL